MAARAEYLTLLSKDFYPLLRSSGFKGSGDTLRRVRGEVIHVVNIQGSSDAERCYVNLGAHLAFLPTEGGTIVDLPKIKEYECAFRARVDPPADLGFGWPYGHTPAETASFIKLLIQYYRAQGEPFFAALSDYPASFEGVTPEDLGTPAKWGHLGGDHLPLTFARIAIHQEDTERAKAFARVGLEQAPASAQILRRRYEEILEQS